MKARQVEIYDEEGNLEKIEITLETGEHLFDAIWDPNDDQTSEKRTLFREWVKHMTAQKGHDIT